LVHYYCRRQVHDALIADLADPLAAVVRPIAYDASTTRIEIPPGAHVLADFDDFGASHLHRAAQVWQRIHDTPQARAFNHPIRARRHYELLRLLRETGLNAFDVYRMTEARRPARWPVFLERLGTGTRWSAPIATEAVYAQIVEGVLRIGEDRDRILVIEMIDARTADGRFERREAIRVGDVLVPGPVTVADDWRMNAGTIRQRAALDDDERRMIDEVFTLARIDCGRIAYARVGDAFQVWGIDLDPLRARARFPEPTLADAFAALDASVAGVAAEVR